MSSERISIELERHNDEWDARIANMHPPDDGDMLREQRFTGSGPADALEQVGQALDEREVARIKRERGL